MVLIYFDVIGVVILRRKEVEFCFFDPKGSLSATTVVLLLVLVVTLFEKCLRLC